MDICVEYSATRLCPDLSFQKTREIPLKLGLLLILGVSVVLLMGSFKKMVPGFTRIRPANEKNIRESGMFDFIINF